MSKYHYYFGCLAARVKLGMEDMPSEAPSSEEMAMLPPEMLEEEVPEELLAELVAAEGAQIEDPEGQAPTADMLREFAQTDSTGQEADPEADDAPGPDEKTPVWGGKASLEGGDAGTRNHEMGLSGSSAV